MSSSPHVIRRVEALLEPALDAMGKELVLVQYRLERGGMVLRLFVDRAGERGITVDELVQASRDIGTLLEIEEIIDSPYRLEVSSPGLSRPLVKPADFDRFKEEMAQITLHRDIDGRKNFKGILKGIENDEVLLEEGDTIHRIKWKWVKRAKLKPDLSGAK